MSIEEDTMPELTIDEEAQLDALHDAVVKAEQGALGWLVGRRRARRAQATERELLDRFGLRCYDAYLLATRLRLTPGPAESETEPAAPARAPVLTAVAPEAPAKLATARRCPHCFVIDELQRCSACGHPACGDCVARLPGRKHRVLCVPCALVAGGIRVRPDTRSLRRSA